MFLPYIYINRLICFENCPYAEWKACAQPELNMIEPDGVRSNIHVSSRSNTLPRLV